jgi:hypothetical protein
MHDLLVRHFDLDGVPAEAFRVMAFEGVEPTLGHATGEGDTPAVDVDAVIA